MPLPRAHARRVGVAVRAMAHHRKLAQTVEMIELLCVMLRGFFAECASVPHTFLERHVPHYRRQLQAEQEESDRLQNEEEDEEEEEEEEGEEETEAEDLVARYNLDVAENKAHLPVAAIMRYILDRANKDSRIRKVARRIHTANADTSPIMEREAGVKRVRSRPRVEAGVLAPGSDSDEAVSVATAKLPKRLPPRAFRTPEPPQPADDNASDPCDHEHVLKPPKAFKAATLVPSTEIHTQGAKNILKATVKRSKKTVRDMPIIADE